MELVARLRHVDAGDLRAIVDSFKAIVRVHAGREFPQDPREQMDLAVLAVFRSWNADRAICLHSGFTISPLRGSSKMSSAPIFSRGENRVTLLAGKRDFASVLLAPSMRNTIRVGMTCFRSTL